MPSRPQPPAGGADASDTSRVNEERDTPKPRWPEDRSGKAEREDASASRSAHDQVPLGVFGEDSIIAGSFVDRVRRWRERRRKRQRTRRAVA